MQSNGSSSTQQLSVLIESVRDGRLTRRQFMASAAAIGAASTATVMLQTLAAQPAVAQSARPGRRPAPDPVLDLAEWSYFWTGIQRASVASGTYVNGRQMYVEYWVPAQVRHPWPVILVHGGGGQGVDWMQTPDGRRGWAHILLEQGYKVYVVDRPGHGRSPLHPDMHRGFPAQQITLEGISGRFTPPNPSTPNKPGPFQHLHNQWVGDPAVGSKELDQMVGAFGGSYVQLPPGAPQALTAATAHAAWRDAGAELVERTGPAIFITHSAGGPFGWLVAEKHPELVKAIVAVEGGGQPFGGANVWGMSTVPVTYDPPIADPRDIKTREVQADEPNVQPYKLQEEPARKLKNLQSIPILMVTAAASFATPGNPGGVAFFRQAGVDAEELRLGSRKIEGNGHFMMAERNNREVLRPITEWLAAKVEKGVTVTQPVRGEAAVSIADQKHFFTGMEHKKVAYGTILAGQSYIQEMIPAKVTQSVPVVLVHGGTGQMLHYMGNGAGEAGWAHYFLQRGYRVFLVDRPGHGRVPYHPDALGPIGPSVSYEAVLGDFAGAKIGDAKLDQFMAAQNAAPLDQESVQGMWARGGAELLDRTGPAIVYAHGAGAPFAWLAAVGRPDRVKAIVSVEGEGVTLPPKALAKLRAIPMAYVSTARSRRSDGERQVKLLADAGCRIEHLKLAEAGLGSSGHFTMLDNDRKQSFDALHDWLSKALAGTGQS